MARFFTTWLVAVTRMSYTQANYEDTESVAGGLHFLRDALDCEELGVSVLDCPPGWSGKDHDHADEGHEEVYVLTDGEATLTVDGEAVDMVEGDAVRVAPGATRRIDNSDVDSQFVIAGAP